MLTRVSHNTDIFHNLPYHNVFNILNTKKRGGKSVKHHFCVLIFNMAFLYKLACSYAIVIFYNWKISCNLGLSNSDIPQNAFHIHQFCYMIDFHMGTILSNAWNAKEIHSYQKQWYAHLLKITFFLPERKISLKILCLSWNL